VENKTMKAIETLHKHCTTPADPSCRSLHPEKKKNTNITQQVAEKSSSQNWAAKHGATIIIALPLCCLSNTLQEK
jgi:hypothetical protein